ncbi:MAG TPA: PAS domain-containing protein [Micropepsaceae bacterium]|nr:PAS domain-containing protein [Micropepsaceae bacterium]
MKHRNSHFAVGYWSRIRHGRSTPDQADIDPKALKRLLPFVFLLDARSSAFTYRLAGTTLCERYGGELRGRDFLTPWDPESRMRLIELLRKSLQACVPVCLSSIGATDDCHMIEIETVLMPIAFGAAHPERFLGVAQVLTDVLPLGGQPIRFERLVSSNLVREGEPSDRAPPPPSHGRWAPHPRAPHLRLVTTREDKEPLRLVDDAFKTLLGFGTEGSY